MKKLSKIIKWETKALNNNSSKQGNKNLKSEKLKESNKFLISLSNKQTKCLDRKVYCKRY